MPENVSATGRDGFSGTRKLVGERVIWIESRQLFSMEQPAETAAAVQLLPD